MKDRILKDWTVVRVLYIIIGTFLIMQSVKEQQGFGIFIGAYFAAMGLFRFGCASGNCYGGNCAVDPRIKQQKEDQEIEFKELKQQ